MRKIMLLLGAVLFVTLTASAQENVLTVASPSPAASPAPPAVNPFTETSWQIAFGYQYNRINLTGKPFNTNGFNISLVKFFGNWFGLEGTMGAGFGNTQSTTTPPDLTVKNLFAGGGVHLAHRRGNVEPFVHALVGLERFRFTQTAATLGGNSVLGFEGGGGMDFHINTRTAIRGEADYLGTHFNGSLQRSFQATGGIVFNF